MFHDVYFDHAERRSWLVRHGVYREVKTHLIGKQTLNLQIRIISKGMRSHVIFNGDDRRGGSAETSAW